MRRPPRGRLASALAVAALLAGCGYSFQGTLPAHIRTVAVPVFANRTGQPGVEAVLTRAVVDAFTTNGRLRVVDPSRADALLEGEVVGYDLQSIAFDPGANVRQYRVVVTMNLRLRDLRESRVLFERAGYQERADFRVPAGVAETIAREETALRAAAADIARAIVGLTIDRF